ncbi:hypothetical protein [Flagellimonas beolgyonensis]|uniref:hypothetical protein n=1 Tax=Flagellimonas beolgyonensis TaxID=864064 RepID=UPI003D655A55
MEPLAQKDNNVTETTWDRMYAESRAWVGDVEFYIVELNFLNSLVTEMIGSTTFEGQDHKNLFRNLEGLLQTLNQEVLREVKAHLNTLSDREGNKTVPVDPGVAMRHGKIGKRMDTIKKAVRQLKTAVFDYVKDDPFGSASRVSNEDPEAHPSRGR